MLLVVARVPDDPDALTKAAALAGMVRADAARRLAGTLPRVLAVDASAERLERTAAALEAAGFVALVVDPRLAPADADRLAARRLELSPGMVIAYDGADRPHEIPAAAIGLVQRGTRATVETEERVTTTKKFSPGRAIASGGLMINKKVETRTTLTTETRDGFLVVQRTDGGPEVALYERRLHYQFLGASMQPSSLANLNATLARLREVAPGAAFDDRVGRPGFVAGLPKVAADAVDLGLFLVWLAHLRGA